MNLWTKRALEEVAGTALEGSLIGPFRIGIDEIPVNRGVYIVYDQVGACVYVGKADSLLDARRVETRILREHLRELKKLEAFSTCYVLPLNAVVSSATVQSIEGWVSRHLTPSMTQRSPRPRK